MRAPKRLLLVLALVGAAIPAVVASADVNDGPLCPNTAPAYTVNTGWINCGVHYTPTGPVAVRATHADANYYWFATMYTNAYPGGYVLCPQGSPPYFAETGSSFSAHSCGKPAGTYLVSYGFFNRNPAHAERFYLRK